MNCPYTEAAPGLTFPNEVDATTLETPDGCDPAKYYEQLTFASCSHSEPDKTDKTHLEVRYS